MFDPDILLDARLAAECNVKRPECFTPVPSGCENELKALTDKYSDFLNVRDAIEAKGNRTLDYRSFFISAKPLITLNLDTVDPKTGAPTQRFRHAGLSGRIRFEVNPDNDLDSVEQIDFSFKTEYGSGKVVQLHPFRGEWEAALETLEPDFDALVEQTKYCKNPLPDFLKRNNVSPDEIRVASIGCCWRREYNHYHQLTNRSGTAVYAQTEDCTIFTTPHGDHYNAMSDKETEAEIKGFWDVEPGDLSKEEFDEHQNISLTRTDKLILNASSGVRKNTISKAKRATAAVEHAYRDFCDPALNRYFNLQTLTPEMFALMQNVRPHEVNLKNMRYLLASIRHELSQQVDGREYTAFKYA